MMHKILHALPYVGGYLGCLFMFTGIAFLFGWLTHTGVFA